jgi:hypothetical protein
LGFEQMAACSPHPTPPSHTPSCCGHLEHWRWYGPSAVHQPYSALDRGRGKAGREGGARSGQPGRLELLSRCASGQAQQWLLRVPCLGRPSSWLQYRDDPLLLLQLWGGSSGMSPRARKGQGRQIAPWQLLGACKQLHLWDGKLRVWLFLCQGIDMRLIRASVCHRQYRQFLPPWFGVVVVLKLMGAQLAITGVGVLLNRGSHAQTCTRTGGVPISPRCQHLNANCTCEHVWNSVLAACARIATLLSLPHST